MIQQFTELHLRSPLIDLILLSLPRLRSHEITSLSGVMMMMMISAGLSDMGVQPIVHLSNRAFFGSEFLKHGVTVWDQLKRTDFTGNPCSLYDFVTHAYNSSTTQR